MSTTLRTSHSRSRTSDRLFKVSFLVVQFVLSSMILFYIWKTGSFREWSDIFH